MITTKNALRTLSLGALLAVFTGLSVAPAAAQNRYAVPKERARQLIQENRQHSFEKTTNARRIAKDEAWCDRNWQKSSTEKYIRRQARIKRLKVRQNWLDHFINQNDAELTGRTGGGYIMNGGSGGTTKSTTSTPSTTPTTPGVDLLNQKANNRRPHITPHSPPKNGGKSSGGGNSGGLNLLNVPVQGKKSGR